MIQDINGLEVTILTADQDLTDKDYNSLLKLVSKDKRKRIERYHFYRDAQNTLLADVLTRYEICRRTGLTNWQLQFSVNEYGKPFLINDPHIQYNLSHSSNYIAFAINSVPVGIDIEKIVPIDIRIANRFFSEDEILYIDSFTGKMQTLAFYHVWTMKESYIKLKGKGLSIPLTSFSVIGQTSEAVIYREILDGTNGAVSHLCSSEGNI